MTVDRPRDGLVVDPHVQACSPKTHDSIPHPSRAARSSADAFALLERFEAKLKDFPGNVPRAATELAKEWRTDRALRRLEALMIVADAKNSLLVSGTGDVIQPTDGIIGIGSGGNYAVAAARALRAHSQLSASDIVREALSIAADIDIYTNKNIVVEELPCGS